MNRLDENNAFNAVGMQKLAAVIATSRKQRAEIAAEADVSVARNPRWKPKSASTRSSVSSKQAEIAQMRGNPDAASGEQEAQIAQQSGSV